MPYLSGVVPCAGFFCAASLIGCGTTPTTTTPAPAPTPPPCPAATWRTVLPEDTGSMNSAATNLLVPHHVTKKPTQDASDLLRVFLPGTTGTPGGDSFLLSSLAKCGRPAIGLSYSYIPYPDSGRNGFCYTAADKTPFDSEGLVACLARQHSDALWGSNPDGGDVLWPAVPKTDSINGRLSSLLKYLITTFPEEGWARFYNVTTGAPLWDRIFVSGHSQGAGHAGYLAQTTRLAGAALISGPQDSCGNAPDSGPSDLWLAEAWETSHVTAARHMNESAADVIGENWQLMAKLLGWPAEPTNVGPTAADWAPYGAVISEVPPNPVYEGGRPYHVSMAMDTATPLTEITLTPVYTEALWPSLFEDPVQELLADLPEVSTV